MNPEFRTPFERFMYIDMYVENLDGKHLIMTDITI